MPLVDTVHENEQPFSLTVGGTAVDNSLDFRAWGVYVDNYTARWVELPGIGTFVPPGTSRTLALPGVTKAQARFGAPGATVQPLGVAGQQCILRFTERRVSPSGGLVGATQLASVSILERFAKAALPAAGNPGRLVELTDDDRSIWLDDGTQFFPVTRRIFNVTAYDAVGNDVADDTAAIQAAINAASAIGGGVVYLPPGTYRITAALTLPPHVWLQGAGQGAALRATGKATSIHVATDISGINSVFAINSSNVADQRIADLAIIQTGVAAPTREGINQVGGTFVQLHNVGIVGFKWGIVFDQTELGEIDLCDIEACLTAGIWIANGPDHTPGGAGQFTNRISVTRCQLNGPGMICIADDGGTAHVFSHNNFNGGTTQIRAAGVSSLVIGPGNEFEGPSIRTGKFTFTTFTLGNGVGQCSGVLIFGNQISVGGGGALDGLNFDNGDPVTIMGNTFANSVVGIVGLAALGRFIHFGNQFTGGGALTDGGVPSTWHIDYDELATVSPYTASFAPNGQNVAAATTSYASIMGVGNLGAVENLRQQAMTQKGRIRRLHVVTNTAQPAGGTLTVTLRKNGVNQAVVVVIPAGSAAGTFTDLVNSFNFVPGDLISASCVNADPANPSAAFTSIAVLVAP